MLSLNDALRVVGYARVTLAAAPWGTYDGAALVLPLPVRLYAATRAGLLRAGNDVALLLLLAGFLWSAWAPLGGPAVTWLRQRWVSWRLQRRRVRPPPLLPLSGHPVYRIYDGGCWSRSSPAASERWA